jgi:hypothetical protein
MKYLLGNRSGVPDPILNVLLRIRIRGSVTIITVRYGSGFYSFNLNDIKLFRSDNTVDITVFFFSFLLTD